MAKRTRTTLEHIPTLEAADAALAELGELHRKRGQIERTMNRRIDRAKGEAADKAQPLDERIAQLEGGILAFTDRERGALFNAKKKSVELNHGTIGTRLTSALKVARGVKWEDIALALQADGHGDAVKVKVSAVKTHLSGWEEHTLAGYGIRKVTEDKAWLEVKTEELTPAE